MVALSRAAFGEERLAEENMWQVVVLIPKGKGDYHGIGFLEVMWKVVVVVLNRRLTASITYNKFSMDSVQVAAQVPSPSSTNFLSS